MFAVKKWLPAAGLHDIHDDDYSIYKTGRNFLIYL